MAYKRQHFEDGMVLHGEHLTPIEDALEELFSKGLETDESLTIKDGKLSVNTASKVEADNTLPITSAAVHTTVGNIEILLSTI